MHRSKLLLPIHLGALLGLVVSLTTAPQPVQAHGLHGHVHVTGWAVENLPPGELRDFFSDPDVFHAALSGAMFPDTGYATNAPGARDYGEAAHWEPFIEPFIQAVRSKYGPTYDTKEEKMLVAFLLGCAAHGLQDELFDSTFLYEVEQREGFGQEITDPATDGFLILDDYFRLLPGDFFPIDEVLPVVEGLNPAINRDLIAEQIRIVREGYVNDMLGIRIAAGNGRRYRPYIPWTSANYLNMGVSGSLGAEVEPTARHMQALWERLHGTFAEGNLVVHAWPDPPRRLRSADHNSVASWITLVLGKGVDEGSATGSLVDDSGAAHAVRLRYTRWGGTSRVVRFQPQEDLVPGATYTVTLDPGAKLVDGSYTTLPHQHSFRVECDAAQGCEPVTVADDPTIALPTRSPTSSPTPSATATSTLVSTSTPTSTVEATPSATATFSAQPSPSATTTQTATPTHPPTHTSSPTRTTTVTVTPEATPSPQHTQSPTATLTPTHTGDSGDSCHLAAPRELLPLDLGPVVLGGALLALRQQHRRRRAQGRSRDRVGRDE